MQRTATPLSLPASSDEKAVHSLVVLCENAPARQRAQEFADGLIREIGDGFLWGQEAWDFTGLTSVPTRRRAIQAATNADVVVLALDSPGELPDDFKAWFEEWSGHLFDRTPVLIALLNESTDRHEGVVSNRAFLETIVDLCGLTFLYTVGENIVEHQPA